MAASTANDKFSHLSPTTVYALQSAADANGNGNALDVGGTPYVGVQVVGDAFNGTVNFEGSIDGDNWVSVQALNVATGAVVTTTTADGVFNIPTGVLSKVRARISGYVAGTVTVTARAAVHGSRDIASVGGGTVDTELGAAIAAADNMANPTAPQVLAHEMVWDGATWDRQTQPLTDAQLRAADVPVTASQATHDGLNANANLQVADADVSNTNPVPTKGTTVATLNTQKTVTVDTTANGIEILAANADRKGFIITNNGATDCYLGDTTLTSGAAPAANGGIICKAGGGAVSGSQMDGYTGAIHGITEAGSTVVGVWEW